MLEQEGKIKAHVILSSYRKIKLKIFIIGVIEGLEVFYG